MRSRVLSEVELSAQAEVIRRARPLPPGAW
jgi:hypothetical protein